MTISTLALKMNKLFGLRLQRPFGRLDEVGLSRGQDWNFRDTSEKKLAVDSLQKSEANLRTIVNNTDTGYVLIDPDFKVIFFNQHAAKFVESELHKTLVEGADAVAL